MEVKEYQNIIKETAVYPKEIGLLYCALGVCGEAGEIAEKIKKIYRDKKGLITESDSLAIRKEIGDVMWYVTALANEFGFTLEEIMEENYNKLISRRNNNTLHGSGDNR